MNISAEDVLTAIGKVKALKGTADFHNTARYNGWDDALDKAVETLIDHFTGLEKGEPSA